ncbi:MAG: hypothetical protein ACRD0P_30005, partial [Stackebrandtia sp.]
IPVYLNADGGTRGAGGGSSPPASAPPSSPPAAERPTFIPPDWTPVAGKPGEATGGCRTDNGYVVTSQNTAYQVCDVVEESLGKVGVQAALIPKTGCAGFFIRRNGEPAELFEACSHSHVKLRKWKENGEQETLGDREMYLTGQIRLGALLEDDVLRLYVGDAMILSVRDGSYQFGKVALTAKGDEIRFSGLTIWTKRK